MPFVKAWNFLKASRQTELGEFHPDFPSSYGPVTMRRWHPTREWGESWENQADVGLEDYNSNAFQPYEKLIHEGLKTATPTAASALWEEEGLANKEQDIDTDVKPFNINENKKGNWFYPKGALSEWAKLVSHEFMDGRKQIGVRMPLSQVLGQFRNKGYQNEGPEGFVEQDIPPQYLVQLPSNWTGEGQATWGARGE